MANDAISGLGGKITAGGTEISHIKNWNLDESSSVAQYASSSTAGYTKTEGGTKKATLRFDIYKEDGHFHFDPSTIVLNASLAFVGFVGAAGSTQVFSATAVVANIAHIVDIETNQIIGATVTCEVDGVWTIS